MAQRTQWVVVGAGSIGRRHIRNLLSMGANVVAVRRDAVPLDGELAAIAVHSGLNAVPSGDTTIAIICTPTANHMPDAIAAARAGFHVLIEKPLAHSLSGVGELCDALERSGARGGVAYCLRFHPVIRALLARLDDSGVGRPFHASAWCGSDLSTWRPGRDPRDTYSARAELGGGVVLDLSHELDYLRLLLGDVRGVSARLDQHGSFGTETEDSADILLEFESGARATCHLDYLAKPPIRGGVLLCAEGAFRWDLLAPALETSGPGSTEGAWRPVPLPAGWTWNQMYLDELAGFERAARAGVEWEGGIESGARTLAVALAVARADAAGSRVAVAR